MKITQLLVGITMYNLRLLVNSTITETCDAHLARQYAKLKPYHDIWITALLDTCSQAVASSQLSKQCNTLMIRARKEVN